MPRYLIIAPLTAGLFHGLTGFAGPIIIMLLLAPFFAIQRLTPVAALCGVCLNLFLIVLHKKVVSWSIIRPLIIPSLLGIPFGYFLLQGVDSFRAKKIIGILILFFLVVQYVMHKKKSLFPRRTADLLAWLGGVFGFAYNVNGPQLAAWMITKQIDKETSILISTTYFLLFGLFFVGTHLATGGYDAIDNRGAISSMLGIMLGGARGGDWLRRRLGEQQFHFLLHFFLGMSALLFLL